MNRQGQGVSYDFTIDRADRNKQLAIEFDVEISSGTYAPDDVTIHVYDITNGQLMPISANNGIQSDGRGVVHFSSNSSESYRLIFHVASDLADAYTLKIDNIRVGPQVIAQSFAGSDDVAFSPSVTNVSFSSVEAVYRQVGKYAEIQINGVVSAVSGAVTIDMPNGLTVDENGWVPTSDAAAIGQAGHRCRGS